MDKRVVCTRTDSSVAIICPSARCVEVLAEGGGILFDSVGRRGLLKFMRERLSENQVKTILATNMLTSSVARAWEIEKYVRCPKWRRDRDDREAFAAKWIDALIYGGLDEMEAIALIGEFSKPLHATALQIVDKSEINSDRTHRDAWRRSTNGGPIWIDEAAAQRIDEKFSWSSYERQSQ